MHNNKYSIFPIVVKCELETVLKKAKSITQDMRTNEALTIFDQIDNCINLVCRFTTESEQLLIDQIEEINDEMISLHQQEADCNDNQTTLKNILNELNSQKMKLYEKKRLSEGDIYLLKREISEKEADIDEEEKKRKIGLLSSINPFVGIVSAFVNDNPLHLIPFYSAVEGIISVLTQEKENHERRLDYLNEERRDIENNLVEIDKRLHENECNIRSNNLKTNKLRDKIAASNQKVQLLGKYLTLKRNLSKNMTLISKKLLSLKNEVSCYKEMALGGIIEMSEIKSLIYQFESLVAINT